MTAKTRTLRELISIGPAMLRDFELLGIRSVAELARQNPQRMYEKMERMTGQRQDPCVLDTFCAAVSQARNPRLAAIFQGAVSPSSAASAATRRPSRSVRPGAGSI